MEYHCLIRNSELVFLNFQSQKNLQQNEVMLVNKEEEERISQKDWIDTYFKYTPRYHCLPNLPRDPSQPSIHHIPDDCLDLIFSFLSFEELVSLCSVCKRWYNGCLFAFSRRGNRLFMFMIMKYMNTRYFAGVRRNRPIIMS